MVRLTLLLSWLALQCASQCALIADAMACSKPNCHWAGYCVDPCPTVNDQTSCEAASCSWNGTCAAQAFCPGQSQALCTSGGCIWKTSCEPVCRPAVKCGTNSNPLTISEDFSAGLGPWWSLSGNNEIFPFNQQICGFNHSVKWFNQDFNGNSDVTISYDWTASDDGGFETYVMLGTSDILNGADFGCLLLAGCSGGYGPGVCKLTVQPPPPYRFPGSPNVDVQLTVGVTYKLRVTYVKSTQTVNVDLFNSAMQSLGSLTGVPLPKSYDRFGILLGRSSAYTCADNLNVQASTCVQQACQVSPQCPVPSASLSVSQNFLAPVPLNNWDLNSFPLPSSGPATIIPNLGLCGTAQNYAFYGPPIDGDGPVSISYPWVASDASGFETYVIFASEDGWARAKSGDTSCLFFAGCDGGFQGSGFCQLTVMSPGGQSTPPTNPSLNLTTNTVYHLNFVTNDGTVTVWLGDSSNTQLISLTVPSVGTKASRFGVLVGRGGTTTCVKSLTIQGSSCPPPQCVQPQPCAVGSPFAFNDRFTDLAAWRNDVLTQAPPPTVANNMMCGADHAVKIFGTDLNGGGDVLISYDFMGSDPNSLESYVLLGNADAKDNHTECVVVAGCNGGNNGNGTAGSCQLNVDSPPPYSHNFHPGPTAPVLANRWYTLQFRYSRAQNSITVSLLDGVNLLITYSAPAPRQFTRFGVVLGRTPNNVCIRNFAIQGSVCTSPCMNPNRCQGVNTNFSLVDDFSHGLSNWLPGSLTPDVPVIVNNQLCASDHGVRLLATDFTGDAPVFIAYDWTASNDTGFETYVVLSNPDVTPNSTACVVIAGCDGGYMGAGYCRLTVQSPPGGGFSIPNAPVVPLQIGHVYTIIFSNAMGFVNVSLLEGNKVLASVGPVGLPRKFTRYGLLVGRGGQLTCARNFRVNASICKAPTPPSCVAPGRCPQPSSAATVSDTFTTGTLSQWQAGVIPNEAQLANNRLCGTNQALRLLNNVLAGDNDATITVDWSTNEVGGFEVYVVLANSDGPSSQGGCVLIAGCGGGKNGQGFCELKVDNPPPWSLPTNWPSVPLVINRVYTLKVQYSPSTLAVTASLWDGTTSLLTFTGPAPRKFTNFGILLGRNNNITCAHNYAVSASTCPVEVPTSIVGPTGSFPPPPNTGTPGTSTGTPSTLTVTPSTSTGTPNVATETPPTATAKPTMKPVSCPFAANSEPCTAASCQAVFGGNPAASDIQQCSQSLNRYCCGANAQSCSRDPACSNFTAVPYTCGWSCDFGCSAAETCRLISTTTSASWDAAALVDGKLCINPRNVITHPVVYDGSGNFMLNFDWSTGNGGYGWLVGVGVEAQVQGWQSSGDAGCLAGIGCDATSTGCTLRVGPVSPRPGAGSLTTGSILTLAPNTVYHVNISYTGGVVRIAVSQGNTQLGSLGPVPVGKFTKFALTQPQSQQANPICFSNFVISYSKCTTSVTGGASAIGLSLAVLGILLM